MKQIPLLTLSVHASDLHFDGNLAEAAYREVLSLNANGVRTDVSWLDIEPSMGKWDPYKIQWYKDYFRRASEFHIAGICVLHGMPTWARLLAGVRPKQFLERWGIYCRMVESILNEGVEVVQVWNEPNHPLYQFGSRHMVLDLLRIARDNLDGRRKLAVNIVDGVPFWETYTTWLMAEVGDCIDIIAIDSYPETWKLSQATNWHSLERLLVRVNDSTDIWAGKIPAILETGYSTYVPLLRTASKQAEWIRASFDAISLLNDNFSSSLRILNWYKLFDDHGEGFLSVLGHFGVVHMMGSHGEISRKQPAYDVLAEKFCSLRI